MDDNEARIDLKSIGTRLRLEDTLHSKPLNRAMDLLLLQLRIVEAARSQEQK